MGEIGEPQKVIESEPENIPVPRRETTEVPDFVPDEWPEPKKEEQPA